MRPWRRAARPPWRASSTCAPPHSPGAATHRSQQEYASSGPCLDELGVRPAHDLGPGDDLQTSVVMLGNRRAAFDPIAAIHVMDAVLVTQRRIVNVPADNAVGAVTARLIGKRLLEVSDEIDRLLHLELRPLRQRPIGQPEG